MSDGVDLISRRADTDGRRLELQIASAGVLAGFGCSQWAATTVLYSTVLSAVYCEERKLSTLCAWMDVMPSGLSLQLLVVCPLCVALYIYVYFYFSERAMDAVGNAAELPGWLARVHEVLIDMFDTLFFCMITALQMKI
ncbi:hypothetical protein CBS147332_5738 [Penicillium roqueforti]|nr:hypothetical protein CBS147332_5738 [Penicillium roqueforti]KAI3111906.1 hypothetical protein CBS147331_4460 [Penicillium roqueforti]